MAPQPLVTDNTPAAAAATRTAAAAATRTAAAAGEVAGTETVGDTIAVVAGIVRD